MIISKNISETQLNPSFTSRSKAIKQADDICRRVMREFPLVYSETRLNKFNSADKTKSVSRVHDYCADLVENLRNYYTTEDSYESYMREVMGVKKHKAGNCQEIADITNMAFKINGRNDSKIFWLYAYKPNRRYMRDLDHVVVGLDFFIPESYAYVKGSPRYMNAKYGIFPQKNSIIVDTWGGFSEYGRNLTGVYDRKDLLLGLTSNPKAKSLLKKGEKLCFVPIKDYEKVEDELTPKLKTMFPDLSLSKEKTSDSEVLKNTLENMGINKSKIQKLKRKHKLKSTNPKSFFKTIKDFFKCILHKTENNSNNVQ